MQSVELKINEDVYEFLSPFNSINQKNPMEELLYDRLKFLSSKEEVEKLNEIFLVLHYYHY